MTSTGPSVLTDGVTFRLLLRVPADEKLSSGLLDFLMNEARELRILGKTSFVAPPSTNGGTEEMAARCDVCTRSGARLPLPVVGSQADLHGSDENLAGVLSSGLLKSLGQCSHSGSEEQLPDSASSTVTPLVLGPQRPAFSPTSLGACPLLGRQYGTLPLPPLCCTVQQLLPGLDLCEADVSAPSWAQHTLCQLSCSGDASSKLSELGIVGVSGRLVAREALRRCLEAFGRQTCSMDKEPIHQLPPGSSRNCSDIVAIEGAAAPHGVRTSGTEGQGLEESGPGAEHSAEAADAATAPESAAGGNARNGHVLTAEQESALAKSRQGTESGGRRGNEESAGRSEVDHAADLLGDPGPQAASCSSQALGSRPHGVGSQQAVLGSSRSQGDVPGGGDACMQMLLELWTPPPLLRRRRRSGGSEGPKSSKQLVVSR